MALIFSLYANPAWSEPMAMVNFFMECKINARELGNVAAVVIPFTLLVSKQNSTMRSIHTLSVFACLILLAGCANPESRIADNRSTFERYSPEVQQKIKAG